jgi:ParB family chromosome partitioning protein
MIAELKQSINTLGVCRPIIVNIRNKTIIAGHQRVRALIALGITTAPVFYIEKINHENEVRINQIHNAIEDTDGDIDVTVSASSRTGFINVREINVVPKNTVKALNYISIIRKYGNIDSAVALQNGDVVKGKDYLLACKMMHIPARVFYIEDDKKNDALRFLYKDYGQFCYDGKATNSYQQNMAQMKRLGSNKKANYSQTYALAIREGLLSGKRTLDFGAGRCAFAEKLKTKGFDITPLEFFRVKPGGRIDSDWTNNQIDMIVNDIKQKGLYDVVICDSVLNSVVSQEVETDVINTCAAFLNTDGILVISGRCSTNYRVSLKTRLVFRDTLQFCA